VEALALALAYLGTLAFVAYRRDRRSIESLALRIGALEAAAAADSTGLAARVAELEPQVEALAVSAGLRRKTG
jgi:hypothetical protein